MKTRITSILASIALTLPASAFAQVSLTNPLGETDVRLIIGRIIQGAIGVSGSLALILFIYAGILMMTSLGEPDKFGKGRRLMVYTALGLMVIALAYILVSAIMNAVLTGEVSSS